MSVENHVCETVLKFQCCHGSNLHTSKSGRLSTSNTINYKLAISHMIRINYAYGFMYLKNTLKKHIIIALESSTVPVGSRIAPGSFGLLQATKDISY